MKSHTLGIQEVSQQLRTLATFSDDLSLVPSTHIIAHNQEQLLSQAFQHPSPAPRYAFGAQTYIQAKHSIHRK